MKTRRKTTAGVRIYDATGWLIAQLAERETALVGFEKTLHWSVPAGMADSVYYCTVQSEGEVYTANLLNNR